MVKAIVSKSIEIDYGHTLPNHFSFCNQIHGHRAKITAFVEGSINEKKDSSGEGMVLDFKILKGIMMKEIHDVLDHGFAVWKNDKEDLEFIKKRNKRYLITDSPPTAECLAKWAFEKIKVELPVGLKLVKVEWQETPTSRVVYEGK